MYYPPATTQDFVSGGHQYLTTTNKMTKKRTVDLRDEVRSVKREAIDIERQKKQKDDLVDSQTLLQKPENRN